MTRVMLEFLRSTAPVFEVFLTALQTSGPTVHVVYDAMSLTLLKLMRRFVQADQLKDVHGSALQSVSCQGIKDHFPDGELVIGDNTRNYLALLKPDKQKAAHLGLHTFWGAAVSHLQAKLPLNNSVLKDLGCLNPLKRERMSTTIYIQNLTRKLLQEFDTAAVLDEWKLYQNDGDISNIDTDQRVDHYWNVVFLLTSDEGNGRYELLPRLVKSWLVLAQANADSERSFSVNARVVTKERSRLGEQTIVSLWLLKDAVKFHDPVNCRPGKIPVTKEMRKSARLAHSNKHTSFKRQFPRHSHHQKNLRSRVKSCHFWDECFYN